MSLLLSPDDPRITWQGAISLQHTDGWVMPWRIPHEDRGLFPPDALQERAAMPAGVRISFHSNTSTVAGQVESYPEAALLDLFCDGQFHGSVELAGQESFVFQDLPPGEKLIELWLPQFGEFRLRALELSDGATITAYDDPRPRWTAYGSSITHCRTAERPSQTWPAIVAREHGLNLTCLGYGGNCHLEPMMARMIRDLPADYLSMKVGINVLGHDKLEPADLQARHHRLCPDRPREASRQDFRGDPAHLFSTAGVRTQRREPQPDKHATAGGAGGG